MNPNEHRNTTGATSSTASSRTPLIGAIEVVMPSDTPPMATQPTLSVPPLAHGNSARLTRLANRAMYFAVLLLPIATAATATIKGTRITSGSILPPELRELRQVEVKALRFHVKVKRYH